MEWLGQPSHAEVSGWGHQRARGAGRADRGGDSLGMPWKDQDDMCPFCSSKAKRAALLAVIPAWNIFGFVFGFFIFLFQNAEHPHPSAASPQSPLGSRAAHFKPHSPPC